MKFLKLFVFLIITALCLSCGSSSYPCPTLSKTGEAQGDNKLVARKPQSDKNGLVKKKGVKKVKGR